MGANTSFALLCTLIVVGARVSQERAEGVYLFDCGGRIQRVDGAGTFVTPAMQLAEIDSTLPHRVRDGCSIHAGWFDADSDRLVLVVQTQPLMDEHHALPTRLLPLTVPALVPQAMDSASLQPPGKPDLQAMAIDLQSIEGPFAHSIGYLHSDGTTLLVQEVTHTTPAPGPVHLTTLWQAGTVSYSRERAEATGRYALLDMNTRAQRGVVVTTAGATHDDRVVCFTPSGRIYLAAARDTLLILDVTEPSRRSIVSDLTIDLYWAACAGAAPKPRHR